MQFDPLAGDGLSERDTIDNDDADEGVQRALAASLAPRAAADPDAVQPQRKRGLEHESDEAAWLFGCGPLEYEQKLRQKLRRKHGPKPLLQDKRKTDWWPSAKLPRPDMLAALRKAPECPVGRPNEGSPLLRMLPAEVVLCIVDFLCFPDTFALALACRSLHQTINLPLAKTMYWSQLTEAKASIPRLGNAPTMNTSQSFTHDTCDRLATEATCLCGTCLYALPSSYFGSIRTFKHGGICRDCTEFKSSMQANQQPGTHAKLPYVPWRPSRRVAVPGTGGRLWYRKRT